MRHACTTAGERSPLGHSERRGRPSRYRAEKMRHVRWRQDPPTLRACKTCLCSNGRYEISGPSDGGDETSRLSGRAEKDFRQGAEMGDSDTYIEEGRPRGAQVEKMKAHGSDRETRTSSSRSRETAWQSGGDRGTPAFQCVSEAAEHSSPEARCNLLSLRGCETFWFSGREDGTKSLSSLRSLALSRKKREILTVRGRR